VLVSEGEGPHSGTESLQAAQEHLGGLLELERQRRVHHVRGRHAHVDESRVGPERLLEVRQERDDVVTGRRFDLVDPRGGYGRLGLDAAEGIRGDQAAASIDLADRQLHPEPGAILRVLGPDARHLGPAISLDHGHPTIPSALGSTPVGETPLER
jgi:hypothetical protein